MLTVHPVAESIHPSDLERSERGRERGSWRSTLDFRVGVVEEKVIKIGGGKALRRVGKRGCAQEKQMRRKTCGFTDKSRREGEGSSRPVSDSRGRSASRAPI